MEIKIDDKVITFIAAKGPTEAADWFYAEYVRPKIAAYQRHGNHGDPIVVDFGSAVLPSRFLFNTLRQLFQHYPNFPINVFKYVSTSKGVDSVRAWKAYCVDMRRRMQPEIISQKTPTDCAICCAAIALRITYEHAVEIATAHNERMKRVLADKQAIGVGKDEIFSAIPTGAPGWNGTDYDNFFDAVQLDIMYQPRTFRPREPAIFSVRSRVRDGGLHAVFVEDGKVYDPTTSQFPYTAFEDVVNAMTGVYQWELPDGFYAPPTKRLADSPQT